MKILVIGAGLSGCSIAWLLKDKGHDVSIIEKNSYIGGLCITRVNREGFKYEPFGARTFHTNNDKIKEFVLRFDTFNGYIHRKGMIINNRLSSFPISIESIRNLEESEQISYELEQRPKIIDKTNFETASISIFGKTLYSYFIENYTRKMWGIDPKLLTAEWVPKRLELRDNGNDELFMGQWQGLPVHGYSFLLEKISEGIPLKLNAPTFNKNEFDLVISSAPVDEILDFKFGILEYRSLRFEYKENESWEKNDYGTINLPQHSRYIRKCNFNILHRVSTINNWIQYQEPVEANGNYVPMYPVNTQKNEETFRKYLNEICKSNIFPIGRLGLFKYLDMDKAVSVAFDVAEIINSYTNLSAEEKHESITQIRNRY